MAAKKKVVVKKPVATAKKPSAKKTAKKVQGARGKSKKSTGGG